MNIPREIPSMIIAAVAHFAMVTISVSASASDRPNVVVILTDDQGWGDLSLNGNTNLSTPNLDSIARDGVMFDRFYVCPVCSPTRAEWLTGRYHTRGGVYDTSTGGERLNLGEATIGETFQAAGYKTGAFGKWHNGTQYPYHPNARGFEEFYGFCSGHWGNYFSPPLEHNGKIVQGDGYITDDFTNRAIEFIKVNRDQPFFCYLPYNVPHSPMQVPDKYFEKFAGVDLEMRHDDLGQEDLEMTRAALAMCENVDWNVGRLLEALDDLDLAEQTIVVYFGDNGPNSWRWNGGMKGRKGSTDEGGVRSPLFIRWPGKIPPGTKVEPIAAAIDLLPTLAELAGIEVQADQRLDGISVAPLLLGIEAETPDRLIFSHWNGRVSVRNQRFRLDHQGKLYELSNDPGQQNDVANDHPEVSTRLSEEVERWRQEHLPGLKDDDRPFPVGYREFPMTHLPARDGLPHGHVERSNRAPNDSYFRNWTSPEDRITWDIEVETPGRYEAVIYYTCADENVGSTLELSFQDSRLQTKVTEAHDPPEYGIENDRVDRGPESFVKDFKPLRLGEFTLSPGRGPLTIRAVEVPGAGVIDLRMITLILID
ncbi:arylsulfatase [soil metagenome]